MSVTQALALARARGVERADAQQLLAHLLGCTRAWLAAHPLDTLTKPQCEAWMSGTQRLADGEPLGYVIGDQPFHGLTLRVNDQVLVPRSDTEVLVDWGLELLSGVLAARPAPQVLDLGTGSGAIALAIKHHHPGARVLATDVSDGALQVARDNGARLGLDVSFALSAWWERVAGGPFDLVLSNPPYIAGGDPHLPALRFEPTLALTPGGDGLGALRDIVRGATRRLAPQAWLLLEHGHDQAEAVTALLQDNGFVEVSTRRDAGERRRCTGARRA